ncbi:hypothetical protein M885DRAFT_512131 [Pelagophyceae sp. CCMP2097]|nr:hypothetical protein M885DRAFT_512131 [Pelagophyceae sp. CCMP2097]
MQKNPSSGLFAGGLLTAAQRRATELAQRRFSEANSWRPSSIGLEATKHIALNLRASSQEVNFGVVKRGHKYACSIVVTNASCSGMRWRITSRTPKAKATARQTMLMLDGVLAKRPPLDARRDCVQCVTSRSRLAPGVSVKLAFELRADEAGSVAVAFQLYGREDELRSSATAHAGDEAGEPRVCALHIQATATILGAREFRGHVCRMRYERKDLLQRGVSCVSALPVKRNGNRDSVKVDDDVSQSTATRLTEPSLDASQESNGLEALDVEASAGSQSNQDDDDASEGDDDFDKHTGSYASDIDASVNFDDARQLDGCYLAPEALAALDLYDDEEARELSLLPSFPGCVYDPRTRVLRMDAPQRQHVVDPTRSLADILAEIQASNDQRMRSLEAGGLLTSRALQQLRDRFNGPNAAVPPTQ